jgi:quinol monooxygenase YgiN
MFLMVHHAVRDYDAWKAVFDEKRSALLEHGCLGHTIYRSAHKPDELRVFTEWESLEQAQDYVHDPSFVETMKRGGVAGEAEITYLDEAEKTPYAERLVA